MQDILSSIGSPEEVQREVEAGYETEFIHFKKSRILLLVVLSVFSVCMALLTVYSLITVLYPQFALPVVIGGSDGNNSFFLAYKFAREEMIAGLIIKTALLILSLAGLFKVFHSIKNKSE